jgi:hypothetical protein
MGSSEMIMPECMPVDWGISRAASHIPGLVLRLGFIMQLHWFWPTSPIPLCKTKKLAHRIWNGI